MKTVLAQSGKKPWTKVPEEFMALYCVPRIHPLINAIIGRGLRKRFDDIIQRLGPHQMSKHIEFWKVEYDDPAYFTENHVAVHILVQPKAVPVAQAQEIVDQFYEVCKEFGLEEIRVEMYEYSELGMFRMMNG